MINSFIVWPEKFQDYSVLGCFGQYLKGIKYQYLVQV